MSKIGFCPGNMQERLTTGIQASAVYAEDTLKYTLKSATMYTVNGRHHVPAECVRWRWESSSTYRWGWTSLADLAMMNMIQ